MNTLKKLSEKLMVAITIVVLVFGLFWIKGLYYAGPALTVASAIALIARFLPLIQNWWTRMASWFNNKRENMRQRAEERAKAMEEQDEEEEHEEIRSEPMTKKQLQQALFAKANKALDEDDCDTAVKLIEKAEALEEAVKEEEKKNAELRVENEKKKSALRARIHIDEEKKSKS